MVNFRFHVVSIVAVFLALAIGIAMGTTVIDKATVDTLRNQLETIEGQRDDARASADKLVTELGALRQQLQDLGEQGTDQLLSGQLTDAPVVVVAARGIDTDSMDALHTALADAGAQDGGTLWLTDKLALTDPADAARLSEVLGLATTDADHARTNLVSRLGSSFLDVALPIAPPATGATTTTSPTDIGTTVSSTTTTGDTTPTDPVDTTTTTLATVPEPLLDNLRNAGFLDWDAPATATGEATVLPAAGARFVVVSGAGAVVPDADVLLPLLGELAASGVAPAVAAQASTGDAEEAAKTRVVFVGPIRQDDTLKTRVSTVDDLEGFFGWAAVVLALQHLPQGQVGHYGVGDGADRLLPAPTGSP
jgi:hypothetical protein